MAASAAQTDHPVRQGLVSMTQTFIDTIIVVSFTGLVIITTGSWYATDPATGEQLSAALMTAQALDRKSTRLNSSHVAISYAVFCLKKKTNTQVYTSST